VVGIDGVLDSVQVAGLLEGVAALLAGCFVVEVGR
jgi:hypothetical protein